MKLKEVGIAFLLKTAVDQGWNFLNFEIGLFLKMLENVSDTILKVSFTKNYIAHVFASRGESDYFMTVKPHDDEPAEHWLNVVEEVQAYLTLT